MDPFNPFRGVSHATAGNDDAGHPPHSIPTSNQNHHGDSEMSTSRSQPYLSHQGYPLPEQQLQIPTAPSQLTQPYSASSTAAQAHFESYHPPTANVPPQHSHPYRQSPYFGPATNGFGLIAPAVEPVTRYPPESLPGHPAQGYNGANRLILPPLPHSNTVYNASPAASALGRGAANHFGGTVSVAGNRENLSNDSVSAPGVGLLMHTSSNPPTHFNVMQSATLHDQSTIGKSNPKSTTPAISTNHNPSNRLTGAGSVAASTSAGVASVQPTAAFKSCETPLPSTMPQPENEPPPPPSTKNSKDYTAVHHHPDLPFLVTHWIDHYASLAGSATTKNKKTPKGHTSNSGAIIPVKDGDEKANKDEALRRIQRAAKDLAWAFEALGAFGDSCKGPLSSNGDHDASTHCCPTTYTDLKRKYAPLLSSAIPQNVDSGSRNQNTANVALLDSLVSAGASTSTEALKSVLETALPRSLLAAAYEGTVPTSSIGDRTEAEITNERRNPSARGAGRRLGDSTSDPNDNSLDFLLPSNESFASAIRNPVLMGGNVSNATEQISDNFEATSGKLVMAVRSNFETMTKYAAQASRKYLCARSKVLEKTSEFQETRKALHSAITRADTRGSTLSSVVARRETSEQFVANSDLDHHRVIAQLKRRMEEIQFKLSVFKKEASDAKIEAEEALKEFALVRGRYRDPYQISGKGHFSFPLFGESHASHRGTLRLGSQPHALTNRNVVFPGIVAQQYRGRRRPSDFAQTHLSILKSRLSHAVTINCHLVYPVYCLKFDKTGKYFITGADDQLVKLFYLGAGPRHRGFTYGANMRGAVLVCTLRGHAGVVTDVDVSVDNALLATASADGDVRIWGLKDGCPVAILRGHKDGANMVSWSLLTPYRLVTCGDDGLARIWDVREAALKRYGDIVGNRADYTLPFQKPLDQDGGCDNISSSSELDPEIVPPVPMPPTEPLTGVNAPPVLDDNAIANNPLRGGESIGPVRNVDVAGIHENRGNPGDFVASDAIDEGVTLLAQLQHGEIVRDSQQQGVGTRAQRKAVKVMCIARCPVGGHFCTGSDDGLVHVWADSDDTRVENVDKNMSDSNFEFPSMFPSVNPLFTRETLSARQRNVLGSPSAPSKERLLATLSGHNNAITDMKYSSAGDRILTASMKDGVVRVWSWGKESPIIIDGHSSTTATSDFKSNSNHAKFSHLSQLLIRLTPPNQGDSRDAVQSSRRKGLSSASNSASSVHCDGVTWTCNDMKIVTSQSSPAKASGTDIVPGSHMIYVWDSRSGRCLLGITGSHTSLCSTLVAHPFIPSVVVSAGSDGLVNVWDLETGECFCTHKNVLAHGPVENASSRGKQCSYLEGQFSPDGSYLILSDESGRVTVFDTMTSSSNPVPFLPPSWMLEQYFANDYYELFYDSNGYCIERGSERPPHLAPKGVRCSHEGVGVAEDIRDTYVDLSGPLPLSSDVVRWSRSYVRDQSNSIRMDGGVLSRNVRKKATTLVENPGGLVGCKTTAIITADGRLFGPKDKHFTHLRMRTSVSPRTVNSGASGRPLSNRYTWVDFNDIPDEEDNEDDSDDEEYRGEGHRLSRAHDEEADISSEDDILDESAASPDSSHRRRQPGHRQRRSGGQRNRQDRAAADTQVSAQPTRTSSRHLSRRATFESKDEDDEIEELVSTHTKPSGKYVQDWERANHFFKMPRGSVVHRKWLTRTNYQGSHYGTKLYCPQVGDSVVYIPRAHYDTLQRFPIGDYTAPWKSWQTFQPWPVVRCKVIHARYRFPYEMYYPSRRKNEGLKDVAIILTLQITGLPISRADRGFPWPAPRFSSPLSSRTRSREPASFEVTMFDSGQEDFIIPEFLFTWRIRELEKAIERNGGEVTNLLITVSYPPDANEQGYDSEDPFYKPYEAKLSAISPPYEDEYHFEGSGYNALIMTWLNDDEQVPLCVWDATIVGSTAPRVPMMTMETKNAVNGALHKIMNLDPKVREWYDGMVDTRQFSDYLDLVEVPMFLSRIRERLRGNYYTNKDSVVADMELIKENCYKYNEDNNEFYDLACQMLEKFKSLVDVIPDPPADRDDESDQDTVSKEDIHINRSGAGATAAGLSPQGRLRRGRRSTSSARLFSQQSSLANLPFPDDTDRASRRSTRSSRIAHRRDDVDEEFAAEEELSGSESDGQESAIESDDGHSDNHSEGRQNSSPTTRASRHSQEQAAPSRRRTKKKSSNLHHTVDDTESHETIQSTRKSSRWSSPNKSQSVGDGRLKRCCNENLSDNDDDEDEEPIMHSRTSNRNQILTRRENAEKQEGIPPTRKSSRGSPGDEPKPIGKSRSTRTSSRLTVKPTYAEKESDIDEDESPRSIRSAKPNKVESGTNRSTRSRSVLEDVSSPKANRGIPSATRGSYTNKGSDHEDSSHGESDNENEEHQDAAARQNRTSHCAKEQVKVKLRLRMAKKQNNDDKTDSTALNHDEIHVRKSCRRSSPDKQVPKVSGLCVRTSSRPRAKATYIEKDSDDEEYSHGQSQSSCDEEVSDEEVSDAEFSSDEEPAVPKRKRSCSQREPDTKYNTTDSPKKKRSRTSPNTHQGTRQRKGHTYYPTLAQWPNINSKRMIPKVARSVLKILREHDQSGWFSTPVAEAYPAMAEEYLSIVKEPMDFRTIEEVRLSQYEHIYELQNDLILTFRNVRTSLLG
ncbi:hypothetical protein HJC23_010242 [Cyclotella cryptica]|uniref:Bromo domain-containing protein n=1 Tax=Cyclotella cryptica TaxID=29204 RepID=A0ABD3Q0E3_9STRA|eukprot:CCRYP_009850-RA/>CCRYP_009850-RA protein AED:0.02 eAED:0.02 QI:427/1/1/1/0.77/0.6/10/1729/2665